MNTQSVAFGIRRSLQLVGETPNEYLTALRMHLARRLIDESDLQIQQIAARVGYRSERAFRAAFSRHVGMRPSQRRRDSTPCDPR